MYNERCCKRCLKKISLGKYEHGLFYKKSNMYTSPIGGFVSIIVLVSFGVYTIFAFLNLFERASMQVTEDIKSLEQGYYGANEISLEEILKEIGPKFIAFSEDMEDCDDSSAQVIYTLRGDNTFKYLDFICTVKEDYERAGEIYNAQYYTIQ